MTQSALGKGVRPDLAPFSEGGSGPSGINGPGGTEGTGGDDRQDLDQEVEEGRQANPKCQPCMPTKEEVETHNLTHFPFRNWCRICVMGRGVEDGHKSGEDHTMNGVHKVSLDYGYLRDHKHQKGEEPDPIVVGLDRELKWVLSDMVPAKGDDWYAIQRTCQNVKRVLGYNRTILRGD